MTRETGMCCREVRVERWVGQEIEERQRNEKRQRKREKKVKMLAIKMDINKAPALKKLMFI